MELQKLVLGAKLGDNHDFGALVHIFQGRVYSTVFAMLRDHDSSEDVVQEVFVRAWTELGSLRDASAFPSWLWSIASNLARSRLRQRKTDLKKLVCEADMDVHADPKNSSPGDAADGIALPEWASLMSGLKGEQRILLELRYIAGLSLREIGAVLNIREALVKSRLYEIRRRLAKLQAGLEFRPRRAAGKTANPFLEEKIMDKIETLRLGAHVLERLSLQVQTRFADTVLTGGSFDDTLLAAVGQTDKGPEFLKVYGTKLALGELIGILNHVDRFTEMRLIDHLDVTAPEQAEKIKQNMFVFEDLVLFDPPAVRLMASEEDPDIFAVAVKGTDSRTRNHILESLETPVRKELEDRMATADGGPNLIRSAQEAVINGIKDLEASGRLLIRRPDEVAPGEIFITVNRS